MQGGEALNQHYFSHGRASKAPAPSHNIVRDISSVSDGLRAQLGDKAALACLAKRALHVSFIKQRTTVVLQYSPQPCATHTPPNTHHYFCLQSHCLSMSMALCGIIWLMELVSSLNSFEFCYVTFILGQWLLLFSYLRWSIYSIVRSHSWCQVWILSNSVLFFIVGHGLLSSWLL